MFYFLALLSSVIAFFLALLVNNSIIRAFSVRKPSSKNFIAFFVALMAVLVSVIAFVLFDEQAKSILSQSREHTTFEMLDLEGNAHTVVVPDVSPIDKKTELATNEIYMTALAFLGFGLLIFIMSMIRIYQTNLSEKVAWFVKITVFPIAVVCCIPIGMVFGGLVFMLMVFSGLVDVQEQTLGLPDFFVGISACSWFVIYYFARGTKLMIKKMIWQNILILGEVGLIVGLLGVVNDLNPFYLIFTWDIVIPIILFFVVIPYLAIAYFMYKRASINQKLRDAFKNSDEAEQTKLNDYINSADCDYEFAKTMLDTIDENRQKQQ